MKVQSAAFFTYGQIVDSLQAYRLLGPMTQANLQINRGIVDGGLSNSAIKESDIVVFQRDFPANLANYHAVMSEAANLAKPVVMDMDDDLLALPLHHPDRKKSHFAKAQLPILIGMIQATALIVTTPYLAELLRKYNTNIFVLPNYLDDSLWQFNAPQVEPIGDKIRIFYIGTPTHVPDLEMLKPAFRALALKYPGRLEFVFYGANLTIDESIPAVITNLQSETFIFADYVKIALAQKANIAIAPLEDIPFNHCKSSIKYFEYSAMGLPGVYSRMTPYSGVVEEGVNGFTASTTDEWVEALSQLIESPQLRESITRAAQETVRQDWLLSDHAHLWLDTYAEIAALKITNQAVITAYLPVLDDINLHLNSFNQQQEKKHQLLSQELTETAEKNAELKIQVDYLSAQLLEHTKQIKALENEVVDYANSTSWRLTRPMRKIAKAIRRSK